MLSWCVCVKVTQLCLTLCDPMDCSLPGCSVHEILQARILEWVAIPFSRGYSWRSNTGIPHCKWILYHLSHQGSPLLVGHEHKCVFSACSYIVGACGTGLAEFLAPWSTYITVIHSFLYYQTYERGNNDIIKHLCYIGCSTHLFPN